MENNISKQRCEVELRRIAWRLQYRERVRRKKEVPHDERILYQSVNEGKHPDITDQIYMKQLFESIPSEKDKYLLKRLFWDDITESQLALEFKISQQAVSKWKIKVLAQLRQKAMIS